MYAFIQSAHTAAWPGHPGTATPAVVLIWQGTPKLSDLAIFSQALQPGQTLRVVGDSPQLLSALEPACATHGLMIVYTTEDRALTISGCYAHYYADLQLQSRS
jgi:hypothetical protein